MAYQIIIKKRFTNKVQKILSISKKNGSQKVAFEFLEKIDYRIELITKQSFVGAASSKVKDIRGLLLPAITRCTIK